MKTKIFLVAISSRICVQTSKSSVKQFHVKLFFFSKEQWVFVVNFFNNGDCHVTDAMSGGIEMV